MLCIDTLTLGSYQTNCYIVWAPGSTGCVLIDPGYSHGEILAHLARKGLAPEAILLTHGHFDHVGAVKALVQATGCALWMAQGDYSQAADPTVRFFYPLHDSRFCQVDFCEEGQQISAGGLTFTCLQTPGHTWGSVCYRCQDALFTGDTLFAGSCGRTDLPGGDPAAMADSLDRLAQLPEDLRVFPGHGGPSTLDRERRCNPYMRGEL